MMLRLSRTLILVGLLTASAAWAQSYTFVTLDDLPSPKDPTRRLALLALAQDGTLVGDDPLSGIAARITLGTPPTITAITCPASGFMRYPHASRYAPDVAALNAALTVVGNDEGVDGLYGFLQRADGTCAFDRVGGSEHTVFTGINDSGVIVGWYTDPVALNPTITRFHGFVLDGSALTPLTGFGSTDVVFPTAINGVGDIIGYVWTDVHPDATHGYQAFLFRNGTWTPLDDPSGGNLWLLGLNDAGLITAVSAPQEGVSGGQAWVIDTATTPPTFTPFPLPRPDALSVVPRAINNNGMIAGTYVTREGSEPSFRMTLHNFLATPVAPAPVTPPKKKLQHRRPKTRHSLREARDVWWEHQQAADEPHGWELAQEDDTVVLVRGRQVVR